MTRELPANVDVCIFKDGKHTYAGPNCPHFSAEDEEGPIINPAWNVQWPD